MRRQKKQRRKWTTVERIIFIICCIIVVVNVTYILYSDRYRILKQYYSNYDITPLNLTEEQKLEDFECYYNAIVSNFPMLQEYKEIFGYDFEAKKGYYQNQVKATTSDYEFFCVMQSIANELPSFHTDIVFPRFAQYETLGCYNMTPTLCNNKVYPASVYWDELLKNEYDKESMRGTVYKGYTYINGEYFMIVDTDGVKKGTKLTAVNGINVDEYVYENQFASVEKKYDTQHEKVYISRFYVNNKWGEKVTLTLEDREGNTYYQEAFCEKNMSAGLFLQMVYGKQEQAPSVIDQYVYSYIDEAENVGYIRIETLSMIWAEEIETSLKEMENCRAVILDLRDNYGGVQMMAQKYMYPLLFSENVSMKNKWYMIDSSDNKRIIWEDILGLLFKFRFRKADEGEVYSESEKEYLYTYRSYNYEGEAKKEKDVYVLINGSTGSAADGFSAALKKTSAVIIGENTNGEGLADSFVCDYLPNSGLVYIYMFGKAYNEDGTDNSLYGTAPDVYSYITPEGYGKCSEMISAGEDPFTFENRQKWDDVLIRALEMFRGTGKAN